MFGLNNLPLCLPCGIDDPTILIFVGSILVSLLIKEAVVFWIKSFKKDPCAVAAAKTKIILEKLKEHEDLKLSLLIELKDVSHSQLNICKILERILQKIDK